MATLLYRLGKTAYRRWPLFIAGWLVALVGLGAVAGYLSKPMSNTFSIPGIESVEAAELQQELFPDAEAVDAPTATIGERARPGRRRRSRRGGGRPRGAGDRRGRRRRGQGEGRRPAVRP